MRPIQSILLYKNSEIQVITTKEFLRKLFYCIWAFLLILIGISVFRGRHDQKIVQHEISVLNKEYENARENGIIRIKDF